MDFFTQEVDALDASVFSGDSLELPGNRALLREHCDRWLRAIAEREAQPDIAEETPPELTPAEQRAAGVPYCPHCYAFGHVHRKDCAHAGSGMLYHIRDK